LTNNIETAFWDESSAHGQEIARYATDDTRPASAFMWPKPCVSLKNWQREQILVVKADGVVAGRAVLGAIHYPLAEIENLRVLPHYRGQELGSRLVEDLVNRAAERGYLAVHLQTELDNRAAHALYTKHGFLPARQGESLRMVRFLNYPALSQFLRDHPLAMIHSGSGDDEWELTWTDPISGDRLTIGLSGGSSQRDSDGIGPGVASFRLHTAETGIEAKVSGQDLDLHVTVSNTGASKLSGNCRLLLNHGFDPLSDGGAQFEAESGASCEMEFSVKTQDDFDCDLFKVASYPSVPIAVEFFVGEHVFWLCRQVKIP